MLYQTFEPNSQKSDKIQKNLNAKNTSLENT